MCNYGNIELQDMNIELVCDWTQKSQDAEGRLLEEREKEGEGG